jgi:hypothetical protein
MGGGALLNNNLRIDAGVKMACAAHLLAGASDTLESETDTFIAAVVLAIAAMFYLLSPTRGGHASINLSALSCAFSVHALLEANKFTNTFVWLATGVSLLTLVNVFSALYGERTNGRIALEAATTYAVSLVAFANNEYAVLTRGLGLLLSGTSLLVLLSILISDNSTLPFAFTVSGNQFTFGATVVAHSAYYVLREDEEKSIYGQFVALAVFVGTSSFGFVN